MVMRPDSFLRLHCIKNCFITAMIMSFIHSLIHSSIYTYSSNKIPFTIGLCLFFRNWVLLDENDSFISQRQESTLALVTPHFEQNQYLCLDAPGMNTLKVKLQSDAKESKRIR